MAESSLGGALAVAERLGAARSQLAELAKSSFVDGLSQGLLVGAAVVAVAAVIVALALPARAGETTSAPPGGGDDVIDATEREVGHGVPQLVAVD